MKPRKWRRAAAFVVLSAFAALFAIDDPEFTRFRSSALWATQISPGISRGDYLLPTAVFLLAAIVLGRVYCSLFCPAGLSQELFHHAGMRLGLSRLGFRQASRAEPCLILLLLSSLILLADLVWPTNLLDPVSLFGRLRLPLSRLAEAGPATVRNGLASPFTLLPILVLAAIPLFRGRWLCDRLCPVGMLLRLAASLSEIWGGGFGPRLSSARCRSCGQCEKACQTRCVDAKNRRLDRSRCVLCLDCLDACKFSAIAFSAMSAGPGESGGRRKALAHFGAVLSGFAFLSARAGDGGLSPHSRTFEDARPKGWDNAIVPPGSRSLRLHNSRCIACQSCVLSCPMGVIAPQDRPDRRPVMDFSRGFCQYDCFACRDSCPAGVFSRDMRLEEKKRTRIARTSLLLERCVVILNGSACGACAEVCPTHAVIMTAPGDASLPTKPDFLADPCIGCGACYHVCPAEPRAFRLEAAPIHETAGNVRRPPDEFLPNPIGGGESIKNPAENGELTDFPF